MRPQRLLLSCYNTGYKSHVILASLSLVITMDQWLTSFPFLYILTQGNPDKSFFFLKKKVNPYLSFQISVRLPLLESQIVLYRRKDNVLL